MATRLYFDSTAVPLLSPTFGAGWTITASAIRRKINRIKAGSTSGAPSSSTGSSGISFSLMYQGILPGLSNQVLSGTIKAQFRCFELLAGNNATLAMRIAKCDSGGSNIEEILAITAADTTTTPPEFDTSFVNRTFLNASETTPVSLTPTNINVNDALIIEIGSRNNTGVNSTNFISILDDNANDLPENNTETGALNPWIEFSQDLLFGQTFPFRTTVGARRVR